MVDKRYYEKLGGFSYLLGELRKKLGKEQTDALVNDVVKLCNELCDKYKGLPKKEKLHTDDLPAGGYLSSDDQVHPPRRGHKPDRRIRKNRRRA